jgi:hypothetical protein
MHVDSDEEGKRQKPIRVLILIRKRAMANAHHLRM